LGQHTANYGAKDLKTLKGLKWKFKTGGKIRSSPSISGNILYFGSNDGYVYALE